MGTPGKAKQDGASSTVSDCFRWKRKIDFAPGIMSVHTLLTPSRLGR